MIDHPCGPPVLDRPSDTRVTFRITRPMVTAKCSMVGGGLPFTLESPSGVDDLGDDGLIGVIQNIPLGHVR